MATNQTQADGKTALALSEHDIKYAWNGRELFAQRKGLFGYLGNLDIRHSRF